MEPHIISPPTFVPSSWNVYTRTLNNEDKTNNFCEAFHKKVQLQLGVSHPTLWKFLELGRMIPELMSLDACGQSFDQLNFGRPVYLFDF